MKDIKTFTDLILWPQGRESLTPKGVRSSVSFAYGIKKNVLFWIFFLAFSVTRFGEISPLWQKFSESLFSICQNFEHTMATFECSWINSYRCKLPNIDK